MNSLARSIAPVTPGAAGGPPEVPPAGAGALPGTGAAALLGVAAPGSAGLITPGPAGVVANVDGIRETNGIPVPDPSAATNGTQIVETVNNFLEVFDDNGSALCGGLVSLRTLLNATDPLSDPRVLYDDTNHRFIVAETVVADQPGEQSAVYVAVTDTGDPCGTWTSRKATFTGDGLGAGVTMDYPVIGQDTNAVLFGTQNFTTTDLAGRTVFAIPKSALYSNVPVDFPVFDVLSEAAPASSMGNPMISSAASYFVAVRADGSGYDLFTMTGTGSAAPGLTRQTFLVQFTQTDPAPQPGSSDTIDTVDWRIDGTCAITAQQYFGQGGPWVSRLSRLCGVQHVTVPDVFGDTVSAARTALTAAGLRGDNLTTIAACDPSSQNLVVATSPMVTNQTEIGSQVTLVTCDRNVRMPNVVGDAVDQATAAIQSAGLVVGTISNTTSCDVTVGEIASTTPKGGNLVLAGTAVNLKKSTGLPRNGCA